MYEVILVPLQCQHHAGYAIWIAHTLDLLVLDESIVSKVIRSIPESVDRLIWRVDHELGPVLLNVVAVFDVCFDLILCQRWEICIDGGEIAWRDIVRAYCT